MTDKDLRLELNKIDLNNFFYAVKKFLKQHYEQEKASEDMLDKIIVEITSSVNFQNIDYKFSYFKKCFSEQLSKLKDPETVIVDDELIKPKIELSDIPFKLVNILKQKNLISDFDYKIYLSNINKLNTLYGADAILVAFDYSLNKLDQMNKIAQIDPTKIIKSQIAYFIKSFQINCRKAALMNIDSDTLEQLKVKYNLK